MEHSPLPKVGIQLLELSLVVNWKANSGRGSKYFFYFFKGNDEFSGQVFRYMEGKSQENQDMEVS